AARPTRPAKFSTAAAQAVPHRGFGKRCVETVPLAKSARPRAECAPRAHAASAAATFAPNAPSAPQALTQKARSFLARGQTRLFRQPQIQRARRFKHAAPFFILATGARKTHWCARQSIQRALDMLQGVLPCKTRVRDADAGAGALFHKRALMLSQRVRLTQCARQLFYRNLTKIHFGDGLAKTECVVRQFLMHGQMNTQGLDKKRCARRTIIQTRAELRDNARRAARHR